MAASNVGPDPAALPMERDLTLTRVFNAPRELVFQAWTDPVHLQQWWGPHHFTNPECAVDLRVGGAWRIVMRAPDGTDHVAQGVYTEILPPEKLVFTNIATDKDGNRLLEGITRVTLDDLGGKTKLTLYTSMKGLVPMAPYMLQGMEPGWSQSLERLETKLAQGGDA